MIDASVEAVISVTITHSDRVIGVGGTRISYAESSRNCDWYYRYRNPFAVVIIEIVEESEGTTQRNLVLNE